MTKIGALVGCLALLSGFGLTEPVSALSADLTTSEGVASPQDGVMVYVFVARRGGQDIGYDGPHSLTAANAAISRAEYLQRMSQLHGAGVTVRESHTNGTGGCMLVYRHSTFQAGRILPDPQSSRLNALGRVKAIEANGGTVEVRPTCEPGA